MSRATWYRRGQPEQKPKRVTMAQLAAGSGASLRTYERLLRVMRIEPRLVPYIDAGQLKVGQAERLLKDLARLKQFWALVRAAERKSG